MLSEAADEVTVLVWGVVIEAITEPEPAEEVSVTESEAVSVPSEEIEAEETESSSSLVPVEDAIELVAVEPVPEAEVSGVKTVVDSPEAVASEAVPEVVSVAETPEVDSLGGRSALKSVECTQRKISSATHKRRPQRRWQK